MEYEYLTTAEVDALSSLVSDDQLRRQHFPLRSSIGLDSMGPMRDSLTDALFPGASEALARFSDTLRNYNLTLIVATNGPDIEGEDILNALSQPVSAFAVTEGGGKMLTLDRGWAILADERELSDLAELEREAKNHPLLQALLEDTEPKDGFPPIRTPYQTNMVLTLPNSYDVFRSRIVRSGVRIEDYIPEIAPPNYVEKSLGLLSGNFREGIARLNLGERLNVVVKAQNRRVYVMPMHIVDGDELTKQAGARFGGRSLTHDKLGSNYLGGYELEHIAYRLENSIYVADKVADTTGEGQRIIAASERSMVLGYDFFATEPDEGANILSRHRFPGGDKLPFMGNVAARLAINVTLDDALPRMEYVEGVPILHIGSGNKALEAITHFYRQFHS